MKNIDNLPCSDTTIYTPHPRIQEFFNTLEPNFPTWLNDYINTKEMATQCLAKNVAYVPGAGFFPNGGNDHCMRLNYACSGDEQIVNGIHIIGDIIKANLK